MDGWQIAPSVATIVQAIVVVVSLYFIWRQLQQQTKQAEQQTRQVEQQTELAKIANVQALVGLSSPFNMELIKDAEMAKMWVSGARGNPTEDDVKKYRYKSLLMWWLILHENIFYQHQKGLLDDDVYAPWVVDLERFVKQHSIDPIWAELRDAFHQQFGKHVDSVIAKTKSAEQAAAADRGQ